MPRLILSQKNKPYRIAPNERAVWICQCGLSQNKPFCDGSHNRTNTEKKDSTYYYSKLTQKQVDVTGLGAQINFQSRSSIEEVIFSDSDLEVIRIGNNSLLSSIAINLRREGGATIPTDVFDQWSDLYLLKLEQEYVATMRVTQARDGILDCEAFYPVFLQNASLRKYIVSASRLYKSSTSKATHSHIFKFLLEVWKDQYADGMRIDLINATLEMVSYYQRLGYKKVGTVFVHPRTLKESQAMVFVTHSQWKGKIGDFLQAEYDVEEQVSDFDYLLAKGLMFENILP